MRIFTRRFINLLKSIRNITDMLPIVNDLAESTVGTVEP